MTIRLPFVHFVCFVVAFLLHSSRFTRHFRPAVLRGESRRSGIPRRRIVLLFSLFTLHFSLITLFAQTEIRWQVETSKNILTPLDIRRGESVSLVPQFLSYSAVTNIGSNTIVELWYRSADISNGLYYVITGAVHNATNGQASIPWTAANCAAATNYTYDIVLTSNSIINLRAFGTIRLLAGVYSQATTLTNPPTAWGLLDWSTISNRNLGSAPFATPAQISTSTVAAASWSANAAQATSLVGIVTADITTNNASTISSGTLADARIPSTIARDSEVDTHTQNVTTAHNVDARIASATQTIAGASVSGAVPLATSAGSAGTATSAEYAGYLIQDVGGGWYGIVSPYGGAYLDNQGGGYEYFIDFLTRRLQGNWTNTGHFAVSSNATVNGNLTVLGGGNVVTNDSPIAVAATNAQAVATQHVARADNPHSVTAAQVGALTNNQSGVSFSGTLDTTNLVVNGAQTNLAPLTIQCAVSNQTTLIITNSGGMSSTSNMVVIVDSSGSVKFFGGGRITASGYFNAPTHYGNTFMHSGEYNSISLSSQNRIILSSPHGTERMCIASNGCVGIGTNTATAAAGIKLDVNGAICIDYTTNDAPAAVTNKIFLFVTNSISAAELQVKDGLGNITTLSPHEGTKHLVTSYNEWTGEGRKIDIDELAKGVQRLLTLAAKTDPKVTEGIDVSRIYQTTEQAPRDWDANQAEVEARQDAVIAAWQSDTNAVDVKGPKPAKYYKAPKPAWLVDWQQEHRK